MSKQTEKTIKNFLETLPKDTTISFKSFLDNSYYVGGYPQINREILIKNSNNTYFFNQRENGQKWDFLPQDINIWNFRNYILNKAIKLDLCNITIDHYHELRFYKFCNLPLKIFLLD